MAFVILSAGAATESKVTTISASKLVLGVSAMALVSLLAGFGLGYGVAVEAPAPAEVAGQQADGAPAVGETGSSEPESRFLIGRVGELSGRLMRLESEAILLAKRIGLKSEGGQDAVPGSGRSAKASGEGGPMIPAVGELPNADEGVPLSAVGESIGNIESELERLAETLSSIDEMASQQNVLSMVYPSRMPVFSNRVGSRFGNRRDPFNNHLAFHSGLDFPAPAGSPINASAGGIVVFAGFRSDYGRQVEVDHGNGLVTRYSHALRLRVKVGDVVTPGQHIADVGSSGRSTGPHLHFEVLKNGRYVDPEEYLREG